MPVLVSAQSFTKELTVLWQYKNGETADFIGLLGMVILTVTAFESEIAALMSKSSSGEKLSK